MNNDAVTLNELDSEPNASENAFEQVFCCNSVTYVCILILFFFAIGYDELKLCGAVIIDEAINIE